MAVLKSYKKLYTNKDFMYIYCASEYKQAPDPALYIQLSNPEKQYPYC